VDVKEEQIEDCNRFFNKIGKEPRVTFSEADLTRYVKPDAFDLILSVDVMEHIEDDQGVFSNFYQSLRPGGVLLISTPSDKGGSDADHQHEGDGVSGFIDEHVRDGYNSSDITEKLKSAGFQKVVCRYTYGKAGQISWKLSMKTPILLLNASKLFFIVLPFYYLLTWPVSFVLNYFDVRKDHPEGTGLMVKAIKEH
jgi:SAM-dependent methyltransferase